MLTRSRDIVSRAAFSAVGVQHSAASSADFTEGAMLQTYRPAKRKAHLALLIGALFLGACASAPLASGRDVSANPPSDLQTVFVGHFSGEFDREMRTAVGTELKKSPRFRVVDTEETADYVLSGYVVINTRPTTAMFVTPPRGAVQLQSRASGRNVWQYVYQDQRTGAEMTQPTPQQQIGSIARQFVRQLVSATIARVAGSNTTS